MEFGMKGGVRNQRGKTCGAPMAHCLNKNYATLYFEQEDRFGQWSLQGNCWLHIKSSIRIGVFIVACRNGTKNSVDRTTAGRCESSLISFRLRLRVPVVQHLWKQDERTGEQHENRKQAKSRKRSNAARATRTNY